MLNAAHRLTSSSSFATTVRRGQRAGTSSLVLHLAQNADPSRVTEPQVGFVVSRAVGPAVVRNRVKRRLRHLVRERLSTLPPSSVLVVRALPAAATLPSRALALDLDRALDRSVGRLSEVTR